MYIAIIDNQPDEAEIKTFVDHVKARRQWRVETWDPENITAIQNLLQAPDRPDVVLIDIAMTKEEEDELSVLHKKDRPLADPAGFGGLRLCRRISAEHPSVPLVLFTKFDLPDLMMQAFQVGARLYLLKSMDVEALTSAVHSVVRETFPQDYVFYEKACQLLSSSGHIWRSDLMLQACRDFYGQTDAHKRFALLCARLNPVLSMVCSSEKDLLHFLRYMVNSHSLINICSGTVRDHIRHSGNVFWTGYYIINSFKSCRTLHERPDFKKELWLDASAMDYFDQLNLVWLLTSLFHDLGYLVEKQNVADDFLRTIWPTKNGTPLLPTNHKETASDLMALIEAIEGIDPYGKLLAGALRWAVKSMGKEIKIGKGKKELFLDHGVLSAARLLSFANNQRLRPELKKLYYHAAAAMAAHNLAEWAEKFKKPECKISLPLAFLPACNLLALCDTFQTWDREGSPPGISGADTSLRVIEDLKRASISGSELVAFDWQAEGDRFRGCVRLRYKLQDGDQRKEVCDELEARVRAWKTSGRAAAVAERFKLSSDFAVAIEYELPMRDEAIQITLC